MKIPARTLMPALLAAMALSAVLSACAPVVLGSAAMGVMVAADRRTSGAQLEDEGIELQNQHGKLCFGGGVIGRLLVIGQGYLLFEGIRHGGTVCLNV